MIILKKEFLTLQEAKGTLFKDEQRQTQSSDSSGVGQNLFFLFIFFTSAYHNKIFNHMNISHGNTTAFRMH